MVRRAFAPGSVTAIVRLRLLQAWEPTNRRSARYHGSSVCTGGLLGRSRGRHLVSLVGDGKEVDGDTSSALRVVVRAGLETHPLAGLLGHQREFMVSVVPADDSSIVGPSDPATGSSARSVNASEKLLATARERVSSLRPTLGVDLDLNLGRAYATVEWETLSRIALALDVMKRSTLPAIADLASVPSQIAQLLST